MPVPRLARGLLVALCITLTLLAGCTTSRERKLLQTNPVAIYTVAHKRMDQGDYKGSIRLLEALTARFPFTPQARQAHLDLMYCYFRDGEDESATDAADTFIRENPINPRVDYAYYVKGLVDFEHTPNVFERWFHADLSKRPPTTARTAFDDFRKVVQQFPKSPYAHDSLQRMIYLRNRLADYDVHVAQYYMNRGAFVGAAQRSVHCIEQYDGAPAMRQALEILIAADERLGLTQRAQQARQVFNANFTGSTPNLRAEKDRHWWQLWW